MISSPLFLSLSPPPEVASSYERKFFARFRRVEEEEEVRERERERVVIEREREKEREREEEERSSLTLSSPSSPREGGAMVGRVGVSSFYSSPFSISSILEGVERGRAEKEMRGVMEGLVEGMGGQFKVFFPFSFFLFPFFFFLFFTSLFLPGTT